MYAYTVQFTQGTYFTKSLAQVHIQILYTLTKLAICYCILHFGYYWVANFRQRSLYNLRLRSALISNIFGKWLQDFVSFGNSWYVYSCMNTALTCVCVPCVLDQQALCTKTTQMRIWAFPATLHRENSHRPFNNWAGRDGHTENLSLDTGYLCQLTRHNLTSGMQAVLPYVHIGYRSLVSHGGVNGWAGRKG